MHWAEVTEYFLDSVSSIAESLQYDIFTFPDNEYHHPEVHVIQSEKVSEYDQEIPQAHTADHPMAPRGSYTQPSRDTRKTN